MDQALFSDEGGTCLDLLSQRFPDIAFLLTVDQPPTLSLFKESKGHYNAYGNKGALYEQDLAKECALWKKNLALEGVVILYVYGIGLGYYYQELLIWLHEKRERVLVFLEDDMQVLRTWLSLSSSEMLLRDPQVHLVYLPEGVPMEDILDHCVRRWLSDRVEWTALRSYARGKSSMMRKIRLSLLQKSALVHVGITELIQYPQLLRNLLSNMLRLPETFHANRLQGTMQGIPAIICGAGVSLAQDIPLLREMENKALIFAGGSAITALGYHGVAPHIAMALDPNEEEYQRLRDSSVFEVPFIFSARLREDVFSAMQVKPGYLYSDTGGVFESWLHEQLNLGYGSLGPELGMEALSVTTLALPLARLLGCGPILFCGVDLSYQQEQRYAPGVLSSSKVPFTEKQKDTRSIDRLLRRRNRQGQTIYTLTKWVMEARCLGAYAKAHQALRCFSASTQGLPIPSVPILSMQAFTEKYCQHTHDLRGLLHTVTEETKFSPSLQAPLQEQVVRFFQSLKCCEVLCEQILTEIGERETRIEDFTCPLESGKMSLLQMDLEEEHAYKVSLQYPFMALDRLIDRVYPLLYPLDTLQGREDFVQRQKRLWEEKKRAVQECLAHSTRRKIRKILTCYAESLR
ncbi:MAG: DUF115 domain-containing protein [Chlamydiae bacterium]|nr:DUF115 domain-containing protein [Chlamydiota bacterium]